MIEENIMYFIEDINQEIHDSEEYPDQYTEFTLLEYRTNGYASIILFFGEQIWSSEDDNREYDEETDVYEPLENYLRREINKFISLISNIKVQEEDK